MAQEYIRTSQIVWGWELQLPRTEVLKQLSDRCCRAKEMPGFRVMLDLVVEGLGDCFPFRAAIYIVQQKKNLSARPGSKRHREATSLRCAEHVPGWAPLLDSDEPWICSGEKRPPGSPSPTIPPALPRPPLNPVLLPEISWAPSALLKKYFTDSGVKKWGFSPTPTQMAFPSCSPTAVAIPQVLLWQNSMVRSFCLLPNLWLCP